MTLHIKHNVNHWPQRGRHGGGDADVDGDDGDEESADKQHRWRTDTRRADSRRCLGNGDVIRRRDARTVEKFLTTESYTVSDERQNVCA